MLVHSKKRREISKSGQEQYPAVRYKQVREEGMAGRKSYLEASYGCAKNMKESGTLLVQSVSYK